MKKWYLLAALAALSACSDKAEKQGSVHYAFTPKDSSFSKHIVLQKFHAQTGDLSVFKGGGLYWQTRNNSIDFLPN